jgi:hypothetical protein
MTEADKASETDSCSILTRLVVRDFIAFSCHQSFKSCILQGGLLGIMPIRLQRGVDTYIRNVGNYLKDHTTAKNQTTTSPNSNFVASNGT